MQKDILIIVIICAASLCLGSAVTCDYFIRGCTDCSVTNSSQCQTCDYNFTLNAASYTCDCQNYYFLNSNKTQCLNCIDLYGPNCVSCSVSPA